MALTVKVQATGGTAIPAAKKNGQYQIQLYISAGSPILPVTYAVTGGSLPSWAHLNAATGLISGQVPATLAAAGGALTITATDSTPTTPLTGTIASAAGIAVVDGGDPEGYHGTEANRTTVETIDQWRRGTPLSPNDEIARQWPLGGPGQSG